MAPNPCPCMSLEVGVIVVAVMEAVNYFNAVFRTMYRIYFGWGYLTDVFKTTIPYLILYILAFLVAIGLFLGSQKKNVLLCWVWLGFTAVYRLLFLIQLILIIAGACCFIGKDLDTVDLATKVDFFWFLIDIYCAYVVYTFIQQLRQVDQQINAELGDSTPSWYPPAPQSSEITQESAAQQPEPWNK